MSGIAAAGTDCCCLLPACFEVVITIIIYQPARQTQSRKHTWHKPFHSHNHWGVWAKLTCNFTMRNHKIIIGCIVQYIYILYLCIIYQIRIECVYHSAHHASTNVPLFANNDTPNGQRNINDARARALYAKCAAQQNRPFSSGSLLSASVSSLGHTHTQTHARTNRKLYPNTAVAMCEFVFVCVGVTFKRACKRESEA